MSILDFRLRPGGAVLCEMADDVDLTAGDPIEAIAREVQDDISNDLSQLSDDIQDRMVSIAKDAPTLPAPVMQAVKQYDGIECFARLINKLSPIYADIEALKDVHLAVTQKADMIHVLDQIQETACKISDVIVPLLMKMVYVTKYIDRESFIYSDVYSALGFLTMHLPEIMLKGLNDFTYTEYRGNDMLEPIYDSAFIACSRNDIIRHNVIDMNVLIDAGSREFDRVGVFHKMSIDELMKTFLNTETVLNLISERQRTERISDVVRYAKREARYSPTAPICVERVDSFVNEISHHIRWIMTESYSMLCELSGDGTINSEIFLNMSMRLCATVCNLFYLCTLICFSQAIEISNLMADKEAIINQISRIKREIVNV